MDFDQNKSVTAIKFVILPRFIKTKTNTLHQLKIINSLPVNGLNISKKQN